MTMAPPLSASLITIELSSRKLCIAFCCFFVIFDFVDRSTLFVVAELRRLIMYSSRCLSLFGGGLKPFTFFTSDSSSYVDD